MSAASGQDAAPAGVAMLNVSATHVELAGYVNVDGAVHLDNNQRSVSSHPLNGCQRSRQASAERELVGIQHNQPNESGAARLARSGTWVGTVEFGWGATSAAVL
jgi:hypothetical protein